jgi:hypothetical protein
MQKPGFQASKTVVRLLALSAGISIIAMAGEVSAAEPVIAEETLMMAQNPGDKPAIAPPYNLTPEMSDQIAFEQAIAAGNSAALIMFLARNPDTQQAPEVRQILSARDTPDSLAVTEAVAGGDAVVVSAFDAARLAGTRDGWDNFMRRHGGHALSAQVQFFMP